MFGLTQLGIVHTLISLVAVASGFVALLRSGEIRPRSTVGQTFIWTTALSALTGLGIYQHGGFGKPHVLSLMTLAVLAVAMLAYRTQTFGRLSRYVETLSLTTAFFFHFIPAITETLTRLPLGAPVAAGPDAPLIQRLVGACFVLYAIGAFLQVRRLRGHGSVAMPAAPMA